jgi:hypothetical protein
MTSSQRVIVWSTRTSWSRRPDPPWPGTRTQQVSSALPTSNAATGWRIWSLSWVSSSTLASLGSDQQRAVARRNHRRQANLIRVLKATVKGPGAAPNTRLINGLRRPRTSGVSGQPLRFSPTRRAAPRLIRHIRGMRSCWQRAARPAQPLDGSDRGCPLSTVVDPPIWHASGTANGTRWSAGHWSGPECRGPRHSSTSRRAYCSLCSTGGRRDGERKPDLHSTRAGSGRDGSGSGLGDGSDCGCG